jgi:carboxyl-terminal processing protease
MKSLIIKTMFALSLIVTAAPQLSAQYCPNGLCPQQPAAGFNNLPYQGYSSMPAREWQSNSWAPASGEYPSPRPRAADQTSSYDADFPALSGFPFRSEGTSNRWNSNPDTRFDYSRRELGSNRLDWRVREQRDDSFDTLADPFRLPALRTRERNRDFGYPTDRRSEPANQTRYRIPLDSPRNPAGYSGSPADDVDSRDFREQFVPVPLPGRADDEDVREIYDNITMRYQNPTLVRSLQSMSASQAQRLFNEVARRIDERALEPSSYDVRTRRALRNIGVALDNPAFRSAVGLSGDSFRLDGLRNTLSRIGNSVQINGFQDASSVMASVMQEAESAAGLPAAVVAYEFANAQVDTLDRFSALEPLDPVVNRGAATDKPTQSASLEDEIFGVGVEVKEHEQGLLVVKPLRNSPAADAGLEPGDLILSINGQNIAGMPMSRSVDLMKQSRDGRMTLRIARSGKGERDFALSPRRIRIYSVDATRILPGTDVGYLSLSRFSQKSTSELDAALNQLHNNGMKSLIIDLRGNPGGLLTTCVEISDRFLPCGTIVTTKGRLSADNMQETATYERTWSTPLVVLIDGDSASASEIFAAAVQENGRGIVVGTRSYGKGSVQTHFPLDSASANLRLTTALFYSPNGRKMAGEGVSPDVTINDADGVANGDEVLIEAVRIARSQQVRDLAKAAGSCRNRATPAARSSSRTNIRDAIEQVTVMR